MMFSLKSFHKTYETETTELMVNQRKFQMLLPKYLQRFINTDDVFHEFPLWAKIWPASWVLADYLSEMPVEEGEKFLEIGAGVGLVGIVAAAFGHCVTMTESNPDALQFARANAVINECPQLSFLELDWHHPNLTGLFDYIVASEVIYKKQDLQPLLRLFKTLLKPGGEVIVAGEMRRVSRDFYRHMETGFEIRVHKKILRSADEEINIFIFRMALKS